MYHHYNNTNFFVTFREKYLTKTPIKQLASQVVKDYLLSEHPDAFSKIRVKQVYKTFVVFEFGEQKELRHAAELLSKKDEILACEWLQKRRLFGINADLSEMAKFKSKIKKNEEFESKTKGSKTESVKSEEKTEL